MVRVELAYRDQAFLESLNEGHIGDAEVLELYVANAQDIQVGAIWQRHRPGFSVVLEITQEAVVTNRMHACAGVNDETSCGTCDATKDRKQTPLEQKNKRLAAWKHFIRHERIAGWMDFRFEPWVM